MVKENSKSDICPTQIRLVNMIIQEVKTLTDRDSIV